MLYSDNDIILESEGGGGQKGQFGEEVIAYLQPLKQEWVAIWKNRTFRLYLPRKKIGSGPIVHGLSKSGKFDTLGLML